MSCHFAKSAKFEIANQRTWDRIARNFLCRRRLLPPQPVHQEGEIRVNVAIMELPRTLQTLFRLQKKLLLQRSGITRPGNRVEMTFRQQFFRNSIHLRTFEGKRRRSRRHNRKIILEERVLCLV